MLKNHLNDYIDIYVILNLVLFPPYQILYYLGIFLCRCRTVNGKMGMLGLLHRTVGEWLGFYRQIYRMFLKCRLKLFRRHFLRILTEVSL